VEQVAFEAPTSESSASRALAYVVALILVISGIVLTFRRASLSPAIATATGLLLYVWLFRTQPQVKYIQYLIIAEGGITYIHEFGASARRSHYGWSDIQDLSVLLASKGEEPQGLVLKLKRKGLSGVNINLPICSHNDSLSAFSAASKWLSTHEVEAEAEA